MQDWESVYERAFKTTTRLQSLQFIIIHRYFPTRRFLCTRQVVNDPFCDNCGLVDGLEHYFFDCAEVHDFWLELEEIINAKGIAMRFARQEVLFGADRFSSIINLIDLVAKQFIVNQNYDNGCKGMPLFRAALLKMFNMEKLIAIKNDRIEKFRIRWAAFVGTGDLFSF